MDNRIYIRDALDKSGIYDTQNKNINAEISVYEEGINKFCEDMERVINNCFISTADEDNIIKRSKLFRNFVIEDDVEELRKQLYEKAKIRASSMDDMKSRLEAAGIQGEITQGENLASVTVQSLQGTLFETAVKEIKKYMPVHIEVNVTES